MDVEAFMASPLVTWVETFRSRDLLPLEYKNLCDGVFLNEVMQEIDGKSVGNTGVYSPADDFTSRHSNWELLIRNIKAYYVEVLQQLVVMKMPNVHKICKEPDKDSSFVEISKTLLFLLGCTVQCERRQMYVEKIKNLDVHVQHAIMEHIQEITDDAECILPLEPVEQLETLAEKMYIHINRLIRERDESIEASQDLIQERDYLQTQAEGRVILAPAQQASSPEKHHLAVELAELKAKMRRTRQELEEKLEQVADMREELDENKGTFARLRTENLELVQDARSARAYRDELDMLREKASKVEKYENEISRFKERLNEMDFHKTRVDELREENAILLETRSMLEEQLSNSHKRVEKVIDLEKELLAVRHRLQQTSSDRDSDQLNMKSLKDDVARLEFEKNNSMNESATLEQELEEAKKGKGFGGTLSEQLNDNANSKILKLELENQRLLQIVEEQKEKTAIENSAINLELKRENNRLADKVERLQTVSMGSTEQMVEFEGQHKELRLENEKLSETLETVKENGDRHVKELEYENQNLSRTIQSLRERNEKTQDLRSRDVEKENKRLHDSVSSLTAQVSKLVFENKQLQKTYERFKAASDRVSELENENASLEKENNNLQNELVTLRLSCEKYDKLEEECSRLEIENERLSKTVCSLQQTVKRKDNLEQEHITLTVENQRLQRVLESMKNVSSSRVVDLEKDKDALNSELQSIRKTLEAQKIDRLKTEQMQLDLLDLDGENQKLQKSYTVVSKRMNQLEEDNTDLENDNEKLQKTIESLKLSMKKLDNIEKDNSNLESDLNILTKEKCAFEKETKKLKHSIEVKDNAYDEVSAKLAELEREHKSVLKSVDRTKESSSKVKELEKENKELLQTMTIEKKTVTTLREDLFNEKVRSLHMSNELEQLTQELDKIGLSKEKLIMTQQSDDDSRYQALESMMEEALMKNSQIKDEKIQALESRLEESKNRNQILQAELRSLRHECEVLKQRCEEDQQLQNVDCRDGPPRVAPKPTSSTREILQLKDYLVQMERTNATLLSESSNMKSNYTLLNEQVKKLETQNSNLLSQSSSLQGQYSSLQSQNAQLQVENTTLQSQCASLMSQTTMLQSQMSSLESEHEQLMHSHEELQSAHESLVSDHESLQQLHEQLTTEYEALISEHGSLKSLHKALKNQLRDLEEQVGSFLDGKNDVSRIRGMLEKEREQLKMELKSLGNLQMDYNKLRDVHDALTKNHEQLVTESKTVKTEYNNLQLRITELQGDLASSKDRLHEKDIEVAKLVNQCESLNLMNYKVEEENHALMLQLQALLNQNQELLTQTLNSKDHFAEEEKGYIERLNDLRRQKEKLEEKIMEQYKLGRWDMSPRKKAGIGSSIVRKARGLITRAQRSRSRPNLASDSADGTISGACGDVSDTSSLSQKRNEWLRRSSIGNTLEPTATTPGLTRRSKVLAKSTTALNFRNDSSDSLRGARSTEDVRNYDGSISSSHSIGQLVGDDEDADYDDGGFQAQSPSPHGTSAGALISSRMSPMSEMLSLQQFLHESNGSPTSRRKILAEAEGQQRDDSTSRVSEGSEQSGSSGQLNAPAGEGLPPQPRRRAPQAPQQRPPSRHMTSPPPHTTSNEALSSTSVISHGSHDLNISQLSQMSYASSAGSVSSTLFKSGLTTSTPKSRIPNESLSVHRYERPVAPTPVLADHNQNNSSVHHTRDNSIPADRFDKPLFVASSEFVPSPNTNSSFITVSSTPPGDNIDRCMTEQGYGNRAFDTSAHGNRAFDTSTQGNYAFDTSMHSQENNVFDTNTQAQGNRTLNTSIQRPGSSLSSSATAAAAVAASERKRILVTQRPKSTIPGGRPTSPPVLTPYQDQSTYSSQSHEVGMQNGYGVERRNQATLRQNRAAPRPASAVPFQNRHSTIIDKTMFMQRQTGTFSPPPQPQEQHAFVGTNRSLAQSYQAIPSSSASLQLNSGALRRGSDYLANQSTIKSPTFLSPRSNPPQQQSPHTINKLLPSNPLLPGPAPYMGNQKISSLKYPSSAQQHQIGESTFRSGLPVSTTGRVTPGPLHQQHSSMSAHAPGTQRPFSPEVSLSQNNRSENIDRESSNNNDNEHTTIRRDTSGMRGAHDHRMPIPPPRRTRESHIGHYQDSGGIYSNSNDPKQSQPILTGRYTPVNNNNDNNNSTNISTPGRYTPCSINNNNNTSINTNGPGPIILKFNQQAQSTTNQQQPQAMTNAEKPSSTQRLSYSGQPVRVGGASSSLGPPTARILPQTKPMAPRPPAPGPSSSDMPNDSENEQSKQAKANSVWYEYGCV